MLENIKADLERWRDVINELPNEAQEVLFVRYGRVVHGAWIGGIFWYNNEKCAGRHEPKQG